MAMHNFSCFEIRNVSDLRIDYRLVNVDGPFDPNLGDGDLAERNVQQLVKRLQYDERIPVAIERSGPEPRLAIPANHVLKRTRYELTPDVAMLTPRNEVHPLTFSAGAADRIGLAFLGWYLRAPLYKEDGLWSPGAFTYISKRPLNYRQDNREIDVFRGFGFRLGYVGDRLCVWIKLYPSVCGVEAGCSTVINSPTSSKNFACVTCSIITATAGFRSNCSASPESPFRIGVLLSQTGARDLISVYDYTLRDASGQRPPVWIASLDSRSPRHRLSLSRQ